MANLKQVSCWTTDFMGAAAHGRKNSKCKWLTGLGEATLPFMGSVRGFNP